MQIFFDPMDERTKADSDHRAACKNLWPGLAFSKNGGVHLLCEQRILPGADEHYVPTLLAYLGKDQETDCWGFLVNVDWSRGGAHPRTYAVEDIDAER